MAQGLSGEPLPSRRTELFLLCGFLVCLAIAIVTVVLPELSTGDVDHKARPDAGVAAHQP